MARRQDGEEAKGGLPGWMATYGDLVTLLLCFFVLLFSMSSIDIEKFKAALSSFAEQVDVMPGGTALIDGELITTGISQLNGIELVFDNKIPLEPEGEESTEIDEEIQEMDEARKKAAEIEEYLEEMGVGSFVEIEYNSHIIKLTLQGELLFDSGSADLKDEAVELIDIIAVMLIEKGYIDKTIQIEGHTDNLPIRNSEFKDNWDLSADRAIIVGKRLTNEHGIDPVRIAATGYGENRPIADNATIEGRAKNRRVEIKIITEEYENLDELKELSE